MIRFLTAPFFLLSIVVFVSDANAIRLPREAVTTPHATPSATVATQSARAFGPRRVTGEIVASTRIEQIKGLARRIDPGSPHTRVIENIRPGRSLTAAELAAIRNLLTSNANSAEIQLIAQIIASVEEAFRQIAQDPQYGYGEMSPSGVAAWRMDHEEIILARARENDPELWSSVADTAGKSGAIRLDGQTIMTMVAMIIQKAESIYGSNTNAWPPEIAQLVREATVSWNTTTTVLHQHLGLVVLKDVMCGVSDSDFLSRGTFSKWLLMIAALDDGLGLTACVAGSGARSCEALVARAKLNVNTAADGIVERSNGRLTRQDVNMAFDYADAEAGVACEMFPINQGV